MDHAIPDFLTRLLVVFGASVGPKSDLHFARASTSAPALPSRASPGGPAPVMSWQRPDARRCRPHSSIRDNVAPGGPAEPHHPLAPAPPWRPFHMDPCTRRVQCRHDRLKPGGATDGIHPRIHDRGFHGRWGIRTPAAGRAGRQGGLRRLPCGLLRRVELDLLTALRTSGRTHWRAVRAVAPSYRAGIAPAIRFSLSIFGYRSFQTLSTSAGPGFSVS